MGSWPPSGEEPEGLSIISHKALLLPPIRRWVRPVGACRNMGPTDGIPSPFPRAPSLHVRGSLPEGLRTLPLHQLWERWGEKHPMPCPGVHRRHFHDCWELGLSSHTE